MKGVDIKEGVKTDWDSSKLTTIRIHYIVSAMHECVCRPNLENRHSFLNLCECLYTEVRGKMTKDELTKSEEFRTKINKSKKKFGENVYKKSVKGSPNINFAMAWDEIWGIGIGWQRFLMGSLEKHGMLMKNAAKIEDNI